MAAKKKDDYRERMIEEFDQLNERVNKLEKMLLKYRYDKLDFQPTCPIGMLESQYNYMVKYRDILKRRAVLEDIDLDY